MEWDGSGSLRLAWRRVPLLRLIHDISAKLSSRRGCVRVNVTSSQGGMILQKIDTTTRVAWTRLV